MLTIVDDLVSVDTLIEERLTVEPINEHVQSCDIVAFNKICMAFNISYLNFMFTIYLEYPLNFFNQLLCSHHAEF